jgi:hypothetical protein
MSGRDRRYYQACVASTPCIVDPATSSMARPLTKDMMGAYMYTRTCILPSTQVAYAIVPINSIELFPPITKHLCIYMKRYGHHVAENCFHKP